LNHVINWTATYRHDSDIVAPYEKYYFIKGSGHVKTSDQQSSLLSSSFHSSNLSSTSSVQTPLALNEETKTGKNNESSQDLSEKRGPKVAWFVSNCGAKNNRLEYAQQLSKYIRVDIYGA